MTTWRLCAIPKAATALSEIRRVLKPSGALLFVEHGRAPDPRVVGWQDCIISLWKPLAGGCHLNRHIDGRIRRSGFVLNELRMGYMPGPESFTFMYEGRAVHG